MVGTTHETGSENQQGGMRPVLGVRLAFIGAGVMAESMIAGVLSRGIVSPSSITASHPRENRRAGLRERFEINAIAGNTDAIVDADLVFLTIKPQVLTAVMRQLHG